MHHYSQAVGHIWYRCCLKHQKKHAIFFNTGFLNCLVNNFFFDFFFQVHQYFCRTYHIWRDVCMCLILTFLFFRLHDLIFVIISGIYNETFINNKINVKIICLLSGVVVFLEEMDTDFMWNHMLIYESSEHSWIYIFLR